MSGAIRSQIGPAKATLIKCLNEARDHLDARPEQMAQADNWTQWVQLLKNDRLRVEGAINRIDTQIQRWTELMLKLIEPKEREAENAIYEGTANGENGFLAYMEDGHETIASLTTSIEIGGNAVNQNTAPAPREQRANGNTPRNRNTIQIRLPTNNLPEFDGNAVLWPTFWDSFSSSIHKNDDISDIDRFNYLHGCLKGEAKRLIQGYFITAANYPLAINKLRDRYGDENHIRAELRKELQKLPPARKFTNSVRETLDNLERILLQLDQMGEDINQTFILSTIEDKMPKWVLVEMEKAKLEMEEESDADDDEPFEWNSTLAIKCLAKIVRIHESANKAHHQMDTGPKPFFTKSTPRRLPEEESRVFVSHEAKRPPPTESGRKNQKWADRPPPAPNTKPFRRQRRPCIFCKNTDHSTFACQKYPTGESRQKRLALLKLCLNCFRDNTHEKCPDLRKCDTCDGSHKSIVCLKFDPRAQKPKPFRPSGKEVLHNNTVSIPAETEQAMACTPAQKTSPILLMTQKITVANQSQKISVDGAKVFLDLGATRSFVTNKLAEKLGIETHGKICPVAIKAHGMFGHQTSFQSFPVKIKLGLRSPTDIYSSKIATFREFSFRTTDKITSKIAMPAISDEDLELFSREKIPRRIDPKIQLQDTDILIGMDYFWGLVTSKKPLKNGYHLIETLLGPVICGGMETEQNPSEANFSLISQRDEGKAEITFENVTSYGLMEDSDNPWHAENGYNDLEKCYSLEGLGINDQPEENEDESAQILFDKTIEKCGERYQVRWPFRPNKPALPANKNLCIKRLYSTIKRLASITDPNNLIDRYDQILQKQLSDGIIEEVKNAEGEGLIHYLPHQAVYRHDKKKLRVVMDASAHLHGKPSLNDTMFRGPVLLPKVAGVLLRWREGKIVIACDIASAFLMLELHPSDRDVTQEWTMRKILRTIHSNFDPLGLISPATLHARLFFQSLWAKKLKWDTPLAEQETKSWNRILLVWKDIALSIPRHTNLGLLNANQHKNCQIHVFTDASESCYATAVYARTNFQNSITIKLLFAKSRLAPKNLKEKGRLTIPKMELLGILIGTRAGKYVKRELNAENIQTTLWSDSQIALCWIDSNKTLPIFVENRCKEIRESGFQFRHVNGADNPADYATRGIPAGKLQNKEKWWHGPGWLKDSEENWPQHIFTGELVKEPLQREEEQINITGTTEKGAEETFEIVDPNRFGAWNKMIITLMFVLRFLRSLSTLAGKNQLLQKWQKISLVGSFSAIDFRIAEQTAIRQAQNRSQLTKNEKTKALFALFQDPCGLWRSKSRLQKSLMLVDSIEPIFLPKEERETVLIVLEIHQKYFHAGVQFVHSILMRKFCGVSKRNVRKILNSCLKCRHQKALPYCPPPFPPYPTERVQRSSIFSHVGLDYLGPTLVKDKAGENCKFWVLLITCLATRAVWLEGITDLTAQTFLNALRRFIAKRGRPNYILSDNATNFTLANKALERLWKRTISGSETLAFAMKEKIIWKFITPMASWEGGAYERLCGLAKSSFKRAIGKNILPLDEMNTLTAEVEAILNSRPLIPIDDNPDTIRALCPFDFLNDGANPCLPALETDEAEEWEMSKEPAERMLKIYRKSLRQKNKFWKIWETDYLNFLKERRQRTHKVRGNPNCAPKLGETVIVMNDDAPRRNWRLARVVELPPGGSGEIRTAKVRMANGNIFRRALSHLIPLEIGGAWEKPETEKPGNSETTPPEREPEVKTETKIERTAKIEAKQKIGKIFVEEANAISSIKKKRKRAENPSAFLTLPLAMVLALITFHTTIGDLLPQQCAEKEEAELLHVEESCNSKGILIYAKTADRNPELCYKMESCGTGILKASTKKAGWNCDRNCQPCPAWAAACSQYTESDLWPNKPANTDLSVIEQPKKEGGRPTNAFTHQIELFDGTKHSVRQLQIRTIDMFEETPICTGRGTTIGTPQFCSKNECATSGTRFCFYPHKEVTLYVGNGGELPLKSWGNVQKPQILTRKLKKPLVCLECHIKCAPHGVEFVFDRSSFKQMEVCCGPYCYHRQKKLPPAHFRLPKDLLLSEHLCSVQLWADDGSQFREKMEQRCPAKNICHLLDCNICLELIANPNCWPKYTAFLMGVALTITLILACKILLWLSSCFALTLQCCNFLKFMLFLVKSIGRFSIRLVCYPITRLLKNPKTHQTPHKMTRGQRRGSQTKFQPFIPLPRGRDVAISAVFLFLCLDNKPVKGSTQFTSFMTKAEECIKSGNGAENCIINHQTVMMLTPDNRASQLLIKSSEGKLLGSLSLSTDAISVECEKASEFFTRSHEVLIHSSKRCPKQGSCTGQTCARTNLSAKIPELSAVNDLPGNTFCVDSCSFLMCGCALPTTACIFYRQHALTRSKKIYEIFGCPSWQYSVSLTTKLTGTKGKDSTQSVRLTNGMPISLRNGLKLTLNSITQPPTPILSARFMSDSKRTMLVGDRVFKLRCGTKGEAEIFNGCKLAADACLCSVVDPTVNCKCTDGNLENYFELHPKRILPIHASGYLLKTENSRVFASLLHASIQLQVSLNDFRLAAEFDQAICKITSHSLSGCYSCLTGAKLKLKCEPSFGNALAQIDCEQINNPLQQLHFSLFCDGNTTETAFSWDWAKINMFCKANCPAGETSFRMNGELNYVAQKWTPLREATGDLNSGIIPDLGFLLQFLFGLPQLAVLIATIITAVALAIIFIKLNPVFRIWRAFFRLFAVIALITLFLNRTLPPIQAKISMDPPKVPNEISDEIDWSDVARHAEDLMKNNSKLTPEALKEYWKTKSALGTNPSKRQNDPRKYEGGSKNFDTRAKKHESEKKALLAVLADSSKKILERCEKSAQLSQKEQRPIPPEGLQLQPPAVKSGPDPPPPLPPAQEREAVETKPSSLVSDVGELTAEQNEEIGKILKMSKKLEEQAIELSEKYKRQNAVEAARKMIKENEGKLAKAPRDEPSTSAAAYGPWIPPNHDTERERHHAPHRGNGGRGPYKRYGYRGPPYGSFNPY